MTDMAVPKTKTATYADIEALPPHVTGEIVFGSLETHPRPARPHVVAATRVGRILGQSFDFDSGGPGGWVILDEPELHLGPHVVVPNLAGWRYERFTERQDGPWFEVTSDWICEIHSPSSRALDLGPKRRIYASCGVSHLWYLDPIAKSLEVFTRQDQNWLVTATIIGSEDVSAPPFEAVTFSLRLLWPFDAD